MRRGMAFSRKRVLGLVIVGLLAAGVGVGTRASGWLGWLERGSVDARFSLRGHLSAPQGVVLVGIDNETLAHLPRYPFSRVFDARVLERLHAAGARLIVFDVAFDRPTTEAADLALFAAAEKAAPVVFATSLITPDGGTEVLGGNANLRSIGDQAAAADLPADADGVIRHMLGQVNGLPTIAAAVARRLSGRVPDATQLNGGWIDFRGPLESVPRLSFLRVLDGRFDARQVRGKVVVIGATAPVLHDYHDTSIGGPMSGPEVQAQTISTVLSGFPLRSAPGYTTVLLICLLALLVPVAGLWLGTLGSTLVGLAGLCLWTLGAQLAFDHGAVLDYSAPLAALVVGGAGTLGSTLWSERQERRRLRLLFAANATVIVDQVLGAGAASPLAPTAIIAGYRLEEELGRGGMGVVYRATQTALDRPVAIKLIAAEHASDATYRERFKLESRAAAAIDHANVIPVYEAGEDDGLLFIAMRLVDGLDLAQLLARVTLLAPPRAVAIVEQLAGALDAAHAKGLVHRDVKPANALLTVDEPEHVYLTDFGVVTDTGSRPRITATSQWVGTLDYLAPEQIRGEPVSAAVDIYALTGLLYRCVTGEIPYPRDSDAATMWAHMSAPVPSASALIPELPSEFDDVIARGMAKDPLERYARASELALAAARALGVPSRLAAPAEQLDTGELSLTTDAATIVPDARAPAPREPHAG